MSPLLTPTIAVSLAFVAAVILAIGSISAVEADDTAMWSNSDQAALAWDQTSLDALGAFDRLGTSFAQLRREALALTRQASTMLELAAPARKQHPLAHHRAEDADQNWIAPAVLGRTRRSALMPRQVWEGFTDEFAKLVEDVGPRAQLAKRT